MDEEDHPQLITSAPVDEEKSKNIAVPKPKLERAGTYHKDAVPLKLSSTLERRRPNVRAKLSRKAFPCIIKVAHDKVQQATKIRLELQQLILDEHPTQLQVSVDPLALKHGLCAYSGCQPETLHISQPEPNEGPQSSTMLSAESPQGEKRPSATASGSIQSVDTELTKDKDPTEDSDPPLRFAGPRRKHASYNLAELLKEVNQAKVPLPPNHP